VFSKLSSTFTGLLEDSVYQVFSKLDSNAKCLDRNTDTVGVFSKLAL
jgi:hypothetical protein